MEYILLLYPLVFFNNFLRAHTTYRLIHIVFLLRTVVSSANWLKTLANTLFVYLFIVFVLHDVHHRN